MRLSRAGSLPLAVLWALPLLAAITMAIVMGASPAGRDSFLAQPQVYGGTVLAIWTGTAATLIALVLGVAVAMSLHGTRWWQRVPFLCGAALALPHLAFAIGFGLLIMPSGIVARLLIGGDVPPQWVTTQDPYGFSLIAVLVLKEVPFLLLMLWSVLAQGESGQRFEVEARAARSLGHGMGSVWLRVLLPQVLRLILWPLVIVWVYGVTVVDLALVIGPTQPPTIGTVIWNNLNDADPVTNRQGVAGSVVIVAVVLAALLFMWIAGKLLRPAWLALSTRGPSTPRNWRVAGEVVAVALLVAYLAVLAVLVLLSIMPRWPYPQLIGDEFSLAAWRRLDVSPVLLSIGLATATSLSAVAMAVLWFESVRQVGDRLLQGLAIAALALPSLTIAAGQYHLLLRMGLTGTRLGLFLVHLTPVFAYVFIVLAGPYRSFDRRFSAASRSLGASPLRTWFQVKAPLLRAPLCTSLAVGFSAGIVQFVPAQLIAAGRFSTLPMEAVTLSAGGNRSLTAAYALALALPALAAFAFAAFFGRPRWR